MGINRLGLISSTGDRPEMLLDFIASMSKFNTVFTELFIVLQEWKADDVLRLSNIVPANTYLFNLQERIGAHNSKVLALSKMSELYPDYSVVSLDDDMLISEKTRFDNGFSIIESNKGIGILSLGWVNSQLKVKNYHMVDKLIKQKIVYTGGGMFLRKELADIIVKIGEKNLWCDNTEWSIVSYVNGFENYRWRGSCTVHKILSKGGRKKFIKDSPDVAYPDNRLVDTFSRPAKDGSYLIPNSSQVTTKADILHKQFKRI